MLERDLLVTLHLRIRLVATVNLQLHAAKRQTRALNDRGRRRPVEKAQGNAPWVSMSPRTARNFSRRVSSRDSGKSELSELDFGNSSEDEDGRAFGGDEDEEEEEEDESSGDQSERTIEDLVIGDPGKANRLQRRWLAAMSEGKDLAIAQLFTRYALRLQFMFCF